MKTGLDELCPLKQAERVPGLLAEKDQQILPADVLGFEPALNSLNIANEIIIHKGAGHRFVNEHKYDRPGGRRQAAGPGLLDSSLKTKS